MRAWVIGLFLLSLVGVALILIGGTALVAIGVACMGIAAVGAVSLAFFVVGRSEDEARAGGGGAARGRSRRLNGDGRLDLTAAAAVSRGDNTKPRAAVPEAAVRVDDLAGHPLRLLGGEPGDQPRGVLRRAPAAARHRRDHLAGSSSDAQPVSVGPGLTAFTVIPRGASAADSAA